MRWTKTPPPAAQWQMPPEIDGNLFIDEGHQDLNVGDIVTVEVDEAGEYDLWGRLAPAL